MDVLKQSRLPDKAQPQGSAAANGGPPTCAGTLLARLSTAGEAVGTDPMFWKSASPAVSLVLDLIAASEGFAAATHGNVLVVNFSGVQTAISAARRLQWAVQGFAEDAKNRGTAVALLVLSAEDQSGQRADGFLPLLNQAKQGQILLTEKSCQNLRDLPGFPLRAASETGLQELLWRGPESESARSFDEKHLAQLIEKHGVNAEAEPEAPPAVPKTIGDLDAKPDSANENVIHSASRPSLPGDKKIWLIGGACAALILVILVIFAMSHGKAPESTVGTPPAPTPAATPKAATTSAPVVPSTLPAATPPPQSVSPPPQNQPRPSKADLRAAKGKHDKSTIEPKDESVPEPKATPPRPSGRCDLDQQEIADEIETAERSLARGTYKDSERQFGAVLACEPGNGRARAGLERVRKAQTER